MEKPKTRAVNRAQVTRKEGDEDPGATETPESESVYIRVRHAVLLPIQTPTSTTSPAYPPLTGHIYLIEGTLDNIKRYAGGTVNWVVKVAQLLCDPLREGQLYTHTTETSSHWYTLDRTSGWRRVVLGDPLQPGIYEFEPVSPIHLSRIGERRNLSKTARGDEPSSAQFCEDLIARDGKCVVCHTNPVIASHLIPRRLGTDGAKAAVERFCGTRDAVGVHRFDPRIGILLFVGLAKYVECYQVGFYHAMVSYQLALGAVT